MRNPMLLLGGSLLLLVCSTGCVNVGREVNGNFIDETLVKKVVLGETTKAQITDWFGAPFRIDQADVTSTAQGELSRFTGDQLTLVLDPALYNDVYLYQRTYIKRFALILFIPFNYYSSHVRYDRLAVVFDEHDKVVAIGWDGADWDED